MVQFSSSIQAQFPPSLQRYHTLVPRRIPHELDIGFFNLFERKQFHLDIPRDLPAQVTPGRRQGHLHIYARTLQRDVINETKINNVQGNLRVVAIPKLVPHLLLRQRRQSKRVRQACALRTDGTLRIHTEAPYTPPKFNASVTPEAFLRKVCLAF